MYSGLQSLKDSEDCVRVGFVGDIYDESGSLVPSTEITDAHKTALRKLCWEDSQLIPIFLEDTLAKGHYDGYCKSVLWPLLHYLVSETNSNDNCDNQNWAAYQEVNKIFADNIKSIYKSGDIVWIQDYHLFLVPGLCRKLMPEAIISFFLHSPFPASEVFRSSPNRKELLEGILGANQVGFQTYSYARHFISSCTRVLGLDSTPTGVDYSGRYISVGIYPIGIDVDTVTAQRNSDGVAAKIKAIKEMHGDKKIIIGRDKVDQVTGVLQKLYSFEKFLELHPEWVNKIVLIQINTPVQRQDPKLEAKISEVVSRINGTFGSLEHTPVYRYSQRIEREEYYALLAAADVGLITSIRDGMNTTCQEYVLCQRDNAGPLILSEFAGTAGSLSAALLVNPWDYTGVAESIHEALTMSKEDRSLKHEQLYNYIVSHPSKAWAKHFIDDLKNRSLSKDDSLPTPILDTQALVKQYNSAKKRLLLFDYDGTLTPIRETPGAAVPPQETIEGLTQLASNPNNVVWVISGRDQEFLDQWLGQIPNLGFSAEHGCFIKYPHPKNENPWINLAAEFDFSWKKDVVDIFNYYTERTPGSFVEHKLCAVTWHYRMADPEYGMFQAKECRNHLEDAIVSKKPVEILVGKKNLEVRPVELNKGEIVKKLVAATENCEFVFCAGDDKTDEDMFRALRKSELPENYCFSCTIGSANKKTQASWHVPYCEDIIKAISLLGEQSS
ncbi:hypothetical protein K493DRAFT_221227 [Basidiobolus meristosporus CBS 931.73]|uniref:Uncharacterized protein n=1 Tax=Basidiobolus meristosporus CBS 931.73 TaxID=1314790 RepID=A0A1Y1Y8W1_9FUNG|nr:hypothetical protein K493DRAFT_221227 [Basidiobolus meristosporus CBS 931.73]|eukprot:ORX94443.1 hypothetical protein K493DRAFT_221227 [Basidiobolus meristosporus CBS 931.73]